MQPPVLQSSVTSLKLSLAVLLTLPLPSFDVCPVQSSSEYGDLENVFGMIWRFLPVLDPSVSVMVSRDLDSRFTSREQAVVTDWLDQSNLPFHIIRDHPGHFYSEILIVNTS